MNIMRFDKNSYFCLIFVCLQNYVITKITHIGMYMSVDTTFINIIFIMFCAVIYNLYAK